MTFILKLFALSRKSVALKCHLCWRRQRLSSHSNHLVLFNRSVAMG